jgi:hypothetical protein
VPSSGDMEQRWPIQAKRWNATLRVRLPAGTGGPARRSVLAKIMRSSTTPSIGKKGSMSKWRWVQHDVEQEFLEFDDFCPDAAARFPPPVGVKSRVARGLNHDTCRMAFHDSVEHSPQSSRVILGGHQHNGSELMLVAPSRKYLTFTFGSIDSGD